MSKQVFIANANEANGVDTTVKSELSGTKDGSNVKLDTNTVDSAADAQLALQVIQGTGNPKAPFLISEAFKAKEVTFAEYFAHKKPTAQEISIPYGTNVLTPSSPIATDVYALTLTDVTPGTFQLDSYEREVIGSHTDATLATALVAAINDVEGAIQKAGLATAIDGKVLKAGASIANVACNTHNLTLTKGSTTVTQTSTSFANGDLLVDKVTGAAYVVSGKTANAFNLDRPFSGDSIVLSGNTEPIRIASGNVSANADNAIIITMADNKVARLGFAEELENTAVQYTQKMNPGVGNYDQVAAAEIEAESYGRGITNKVQFTNPNPKYADDTKTYNMAVIKYKQSFESKTGFGQGYEKEKMITIFIDSSNLSDSNEISAFVGDLKSYGA